MRVLADLLVWLLRLPPGPTCVALEQAEDELDAADKLRQHGKHCLGSRTSYRQSR